ncbi:NADH-quinone oxidoreductase subunit I [Streptomyces sp. CC228A]|uniref:NuoI/complex I 23 kDa subunit family protein n=1 Tax=Streptomyces sp. CC228A TaxID=2898186 RepID=UPI001F4147F4|nr:NADH-quinone oxidoreductase subunit I [Streptomyces sp. CC228A]
MAPLPGSGLAKGLAVTLRTMTKKTVTAQYPDVQPELPPRTRGVIGLFEENCTVCMLCARECPDWCIYIDSHKETVPPAAPGGRERSRNVLDRFAIDFALCMYCGICVEVCPFDALFWSPEFEYAETDIRDLTHERDKLREWMWTVPEPPALDPAAEEPKELAAARKAADKLAAQQAATEPTPAQTGPSAATPGATGPSAAPPDAGTPKNDAPAAAGGTRPSQPGLPQPAPSPPDSTEDRSPQPGPTQGTTPPGTTPPGTTPPGTGPQGSPSADTPSEDPASDGTPPRRPSPRPAEGPGATEGGSE